VLKQEFRGFLRNPVTAWEHDVRDVAGVALRLVGDDLAESALAADREYRHGQGVSRLRIVASTSRRKVLK
jgi:hypothetical protein